MTYILYAKYTGKSWNSDVYPNCILHFRASSQKTHVVFVIKTNCTMFREVSIVRTTIHNHAVRVKYRISER